MALSKITISSLSEYIEKIEIYPSRLFSFRGESSEHPKRLSNAFRNMKTDMYPNTHGEFCVRRTNGYSNFVTAVDEFYSTIAHRLTEIEKDNFMAFAQHHGISTNLLDVTSSPLVALFMACHEKKCTQCDKQLLKCKECNKDDCEQKKSVPTKDSGYVYVFYTPYFIDITDMVKYPRWNLYDLFFLGNRDVIHKFYEQAQEYLITLQILDRNNNTSRNFELLSDLYYMTIFNRKRNSLDKEGIIKDGIQIETCAKNEAMQEVELLTDDNIYEKLNMLRDEILTDPIMKRFPIDLFDGSKGYNSFLNNSSFIYVMLLFYCCNIGVIRGRGLYLFPNMIYKPKITFDRARQQQGHFIYQGYFAMGDSIYHAQEIEHNHVIEIRNKDKILSQLDKIGINYGTIKKRTFRASCWLR